MPAIFASGKKVVFGVSGIEGYIIQSATRNKRASIDTSIEDHEGRKRVRFFDDTEEELKLDMILIGGQVPEYGDWFEYCFLEKKERWYVVGSEEARTNSSLMKITLTLNRNEYL